MCDPACGSGHFLIAAAHRIAKALASVRTGEEEPAPDAIRTALRDVIGHCIYGVDINEMAVELCKVNLWIEALEPGKPLSFLDHRIQRGNSLLGTTPALMARGIPDDAFQPIEGDDKKVVSALRKQNQQERKQRAAQVRQLGLFDAAPPANYGALAAEVQALDAIPDATLDGIRDKERRYRALADDPDYIAARLLADAWCAAFVWEKVSPRPEGEGPGVRAMTDLFYRRLEADPHADALRGVRQQITRLADQYQFFHWHIAFPDVFSPHPKSFSQGEKDFEAPDFSLPPLGEGPGMRAITGWSGGFSVVLGNPPWDQIQLDDREFFAVSAPDIAQAQNMDTRKRMIRALQATDPALFDAYQQATRELDGVKHYIHASGRFPFTSFGRLNSAPLFAELAIAIQSRIGRVGQIVPTGIATDSFNQFFSTT